MSSLSVLPHSLGDFFRAGLIKYLILSIILTGVTLIPILWMIGWGIYEAVYLWLEQWNLAEWEGVFILETLIVALHGFLIASLAFGLGFVGLSLYSILTLMVLGLFTESIVRQIRDIHYPHVQLQQNPSALSLIFKMAGGFIIHFLILGPLLLISLPLPIGTTLVLFYVMHSLFRFCLCLDVASTLHAPDNVHKQAPTLGFKWGLPTGICYLAALIPGLNLIMPYLAVIWISHCQLNELSQTQASRQTASGDADFS